MTPKYCKFANGSIGRMDSSSPEVFAILKDGAWLPAEKVDPDVRFGDFLEAAPLTESEVEGVLAGQISPSTIAATPTESKIQINSTENLSSSAQFSNRTRAPSFGRLPNGMVGRMDSSDPVKFAILKDGDWRPAAEVKPDVTVGEFYSAKPLTPSEEAALLAGQIPPTMAATLNKSTVKLNKAEQIPLIVKPIDHPKGHRNGVSTFFKVLGFIWMLGAVALVALGTIGIWIKKGLWEALYLFSPTNIVNWLAMILVSLPGIALFALANWIEKRQKNP